MSKAAIGIDIGGTTTKIGLIDERGVKLAGSAFVTKKHATAEHFINNIYKQIELIIGGLPEPIEIAGIGIGAPGANVHTASIENSANLPWGGTIKICHYLKSLTGLDVYLQNDANIAALGEWYYGNARGMEHFVVLTLGTGLGGGVVMHNQLLDGRGGLAGEFGHMIVNYGGRTCGCGRKGCLETYVSATGVVKTYQELKNTHDEIEARRIASLAEEGDPIALETFRITSEMLGKAMANIAISLDPEAFILSGGLTNAGEILFKTTERYFNQHAFKTQKHHVPIMPSALNPNDAALLGAAALVQNHQIIRKQNETNLIHK